MSDAEDRMNDLMEQSYGLDDGPSRLALLEEAVREADSLGDIASGIEIRMELIAAATFSGFQERALVAFSWCLAQADRDPERWDEESLFWQYKWVLDSLPEYPQIRRQQIAALQDDFERRLLRRGASSRPAHYMRWSNAMRMGHWDTVSTSIEKWKTAPRDHYADCAACERNMRVELFVRQEKYEEALAEADPLLDGRMGCAEVPHSTMGEVLLPLVELGRYDEAQSCHKRGYRMIKSNRKFIDRAADHLLYLLRIGEPKKAQRIFDAHLPWAVETANLDYRLQFYAACWLLLAVRARADGKPCRLDLPSTLPCHREDGQYEPAPLAAWFHSQVVELLARFDRRNENDYYSRQIEKLRQWVGL